MENHEPLGKMVYVLPPESPQLCIGCECCRYVKVAPLQILKFPVVLPISFWMPRSSICGFRTHPRSRKLRTSCGGIAIKKDFVSVTRRTMLASTAVPISITKRQGGTFIRRSIWRSWRSCLKCRWRICWMTITCFCCGDRGSKSKPYVSGLGLTQKVYAAQLGVPLQKKFKRREQGNADFQIHMGEVFPKQT